MSNDQTKAEASAGESVFAPAPRHHATVVWMVISGVLAVAVLVLGWLYLSSATFCLDPVDSDAAQTETDVDVVSTVSAEDIRQQVAEARERLATASGLSVSDIERLSFSGDMAALSRVVDSSADEFTFLVSPLAASLLHPSLDTDRLLERYSAALVQAREYTERADQYAQEFLAVDIIADLINQPILNEILQNTGVAQSEYEQLLFSIDDELRMLIREFSLHSDGELFTVVSDRASMYQDLPSMFSYGAGSELRWVSSQGAELYLRALIAAEFDPTVFPRIETIQARLIFLDGFYFDNAPTNMLQVFDLVEQYIDLMRYEPPLILDNLLTQNNSGWEYRTSHTINHLGSGASVPLRR